MSGRLIALRLPPDRLPAELRAVWEAGDAAAPLPMDAPEQRIRDLLDRCRPHELVAITPGGTEHERTPLDSPRPVPEDTALVVTTSGSTGEAKGVLLSHRAIDAATTASVRRLGARPGERFALALPLHHVAGVQVVLRAWACGTEAHVVPDPGDPLQLAAAPAEHISLVPTQLRRLVDLHERGDLDADALRRWRTILVGGAHLDTGLLDRARAAGATIVTSYGMTETCGGCVYDGLPLDDVEVALRHDGRIRIRGPVLFSGYLDAGSLDPGSLDAGSLDAGTEEMADGWFTTGDLGEFRDGRLVVLGRHDDVAISGGENVPVQAVTTVLQEHPSVDEVAVVGVPDPEWGQRIVAVAVPSDPTSPPTLEELRAHVAERLPSSYAPRQLVVTSSLPRDGLGKPTADDLRRLATEVSTDR